MCCCLISPLEILRDEEREGEKGRGGEEERKKERDLDGEE